MRSNGPEVWTASAIIKEVVERNRRTTLSDLVLLGTDADPIDLSGDVVGSSLATESADADDGVELKVAYPAHAIMDTETTVLVWIAVVGALVDQDTHDI